MLLARNEAELRLRGPALELLHELVHAMGQPLTALQLFRVMAVTGVMDAEMVGDVAGQVESATEMYRALRMLIEAADQAPEVTNAGTIVERFAEEWGRRAARQGAALRVESEKSFDRVVGGAGVEQGLDRIFEAVLVSSEEGVTVLATGAEVVICGGQLDVKVQEAWTLRVARTLIEGSGGGVVYRGHPVCARVRFARA